MEKKLKEKPGISYKRSLKKLSKSKFSSSRRCAAFKMCIKFYENET